MSLTFIHSRLANTVILYFLLLMLWSFWRYFRKQGLDSNFRGALVISEILILVQGAFGILLWINHLRPERAFMHIMYGIVGAIGMPALYTYTKGRDDRPTMLLYGFLYLFLVLIVIRSMMTA